VDRGLARAIYNQQDDLNAGRARARPGASQRRERAHLFGQADGVDARSRGHCPGANTATQQEGAHLSLVERNVSCKSCPSTICNLGIPSAPYDVSADIWIYRQPPTFLVVDRARVSLSPVTSSFCSSEIWLTAWDERSRELDRLYRNTRATVLVNCFT
jgi:hypothetical protein